MRYLPQTIITVPNIETIDTPYLGRLDPQGLFLARISSSKKMHLVERGCSELRDPLSVQNPRAVAPHNTIWRIL